MPTENRSSNTELSKIVTEALVGMVFGVTGMKPPTGEPLPGFIQAPIDRAVTRISDLLAQPARQPHPEPIAWMVGTAIWWTKEEAERDAAATGLTMTPVGPIYESGKPTVQHQGEPVAWVRFRNGEPDYDGDACMIMNVAGDTLGDGDSWEPVYTHADPVEVERLVAANTEYARRHLEHQGEVERLRAEVAKFRGYCVDLDSEKRELEHKMDSYKGRAEDAATLRAQLAERDALLQEIRRKPGLFSGHFILRLDETLSASAEPRPFRTPDCPDCACVQDGQCLCSPSKPSAEPSAPVERMSAIRSEAAELSSKLKNACCQSCMSNPCDCAIQSAPVEIDERAELEAYCTKVGLPLDRLPSGEYMIPATRFVSRGWHAHAASSRKQ